jgi:peroxiredoxin
MRISSIPAILLVSAALLSAPSAEAAQANYPQAPTFEVRDINGKIVSSADLKGKVVFINFWATWCPPCREEIPDFVDFYNQNRAKGLEIVGLSVDQLEDEQLRSFVKQFKMSYPVALADERIIRTFEPGQFIPTTFIIDKKGRIRHKQVGSLDKRILSDLFQKLSAEK